MSQIENILHETRTFPPSAEFQERARISSREEYDRLYRESMRALVEAGRVRFRPIVLTSVTTMLGLTPLTFFAVGQARFLQPMAISLFFGLAFSTILILILVPCAYAVLEDILAWLGRPRETFRLMRSRQPVHN